MEIISVLLYDGFLEENFLYEWSVSVYGRMGKKYIDYPRGSSLSVQMGTQLRTPPWTPRHHRVLCDVQGYFQLGNARDVNLSCKLTIYTCKNFPRVGKYCMVVGWLVPGATVALFILERELKWHFTCMNHYLDSLLWPAIDLWSLSAPCWEHCAIVFSKISFQTEKYDDTFKLVDANLVNWCISKRRIFGPWDFCLEIPRWNATIY